MSAQQGQSMLLTLTPNEDNNPMTDYGQIVSGERKGKANFAELDGFSPSLPVLLSISLDRDLI